MAAPVLETVSQNTAATGTTLTLTKPTDTADGDLLLATMAAYGDIGGTEAFTPPGDWQTLETNAINGSVVCGVFWRIAASEGASYDFVFSEDPTGQISGSCLRISGAHQATPIAAFPAFATGNAVAINPPASGTVDLGDYLSIVAVGDNMAAGSHGFPANYTEQVDRIYHFCDTRSLTGITSEDPGNASTPSGAWVAFTILIAAATQLLLPDADTTTTGWTTTPLWSKIDDGETPDGTVVSATSA